MRDDCSHDAEGADDHFRDRNARDDRSFLVAADGVKIASERRVRA